MNIFDLFPSKYLRPGDLRDRRVTVTIDNVQIVKMGSDRKGVLYFKKAKKGLLLNLTKARVIYEMTGSNDPKNWKGVRVALVKGRTNNPSGQRVDCIDIVPPEPEKLESVTVMPPEPELEPEQPPDPEPDEFLDEGDGEFVPEDDIPF